MIAIKVWDSVTEVYRCMAEIPDCQHDEARLADLKETVDDASVAVAELRYLLGVLQMQLDKPPAPAMLKKLEKLEKSSHKVDI